MAGIVLLIAGAHVGAKSGNVGAGSLEIVEGLKIRVIGEVVVEAKILLLVDAMVEADGELILSVSTDGDGLISDAVGSIGGGNEAKHVDGDGVLTITRDYVRRKDGGPGQRVLSAVATSHIRIVDSALRKAQG